MNHDPSRFHRQGASSGVGDEHDARGQAEGIVVLQALGSSRGHLAWACASEVGEWLVQQQPHARGD